MLPFKRQPHKMVKYTKTICRQWPTNCLSVFNHFVGLALKGLRFLNQISPQNLTMFLAFLPFKKKANYSILRKTAH